MFNYINELHAEMTTKYNRVVKYNSKIQQIQQKYNNDFNRLDAEMTTVQQNILGCVFVVFGGVTP